MTNGPYAIFTSGRDPELIEEKEQSITKGEKKKMKIKNYKCSCGCDNFFYTVNYPHYGLYCSACGKWLKWANKEEKRLCKISNDNYNAHFGIPV